MACRSANPSDQVSSGMKLSELEEMTRIARRARGAFVRRGAISDEGNRTRGPLKQQLRKSYDGVTERFTWCTRLMCFAIFFG